MRIQEARRRFSRSGSLTRRRSIDMFRTYDALFEATGRLAEKIAATLRRHETESENSTSLSRVIESSMLLGYVLANRYKIDLDGLPPSEKVVSLHGYSISEADRRVVIAKAEIEARASGKNWGEVIAGWPYDGQIDPESRLIAIDIIHRMLWLCRALAGHLPRRHGTRHIRTCIRDSD